MRRIFVLLLTFLACCGVIASGQLVFAEEADVTVTVAEEKVGPAVPKTGANTKNLDGGVSSSFAILSVVALAALSAGVIVFSKKRGGRVEKWLPIGFSGAVLAGFTVAALFPKADAPEAIKNVTTLVGDEPSISFASLTDTNINLSNENGFYGMGVHILNIGTDSPEGYTVTMRTKTDETALIGDEVDDEIAAIDGTIEEPTKLTGNTWGFAIAGQGGFDDEYDLENPNEDALWAGVPNVETTIIDVNEPSYIASTRNVYFGGKISGSLASGTYKNTIVYTVTPKTSTYPAPTIDSVTPEYAAITGGTEITIVGENYTKNGNSITSSVTVNGDECTNVKVYSDTPEVGKDTITCTTPAEANGTAEIKVTTWGGEAEHALEYVISDIVFVTPNIASTTPGTNSGPAFTIIGDGFTESGSPVVDVKIGDNSCEAWQVISNTQITCTKGPNSGLSEGEKTVKVYHENGGVSGSDIKVTYSDENYPVISDSLACPTTKAIARDARDSQLYYVRQMEDDKCWMVDNLKYAGTDAGTLSQVAGEALSVDKTVTSAVGNYTVAKYVDPNGQNNCVKGTGLSSDTVTRCGMLYNWYSATAGSGDDSLLQTGENATASICPAGMHLPSSLATISAYNDEGAYATADFPVLVASMENGSRTAGTFASAAKNWKTGLQPDAAWNGAFAGFWQTNFVNVGTQGYFWSSTVANKSDGKLRAHYMSMQGREVQTGDGSYGNDSRNYGFAVRCVR